MDLLSLSWPKFLNVVYAWIVAKVDPEKKEEFDMHLHAPLPGREARSSAHSAEAEQQGFDDFLSAMGGLGT